jgi:hypothetical protein
MLKNYKKMIFLMINEERTFEELEVIKNKINKKDKKFYKVNINLIKGNKKIPSFNEEFEDKSNSDKKMPRLQIKKDITIMRYVDSIERIEKKLFK